MKCNKKLHIITVGALLSICSISYSLFDRPSEGGRAEGLDIDYTDPETGETRRKFAPIEAIFGGHDQTDRRTRHKEMPHHRMDEDRVFYDKYGNPYYKD